MTVGPLTDAADHYVYDAATGYVTMKVSHFSPSPLCLPEITGLTMRRTAMPHSVDTANKVVTVSSAEELAPVCQGSHGRR